MTDVRFYLTTVNGRLQLPVTTDEEAVAEAADLRSRYPVKQLRIIKETRETIWENKDG